MKYPCLVMDHDDTVVNSTATIHYPCFVDYLKIYRPGAHISLEDYFLKNFDPGFVPMCREEYGLSDRELEVELSFWREYVRGHVPAVYDGIRELLWNHVNGGGIVCVVSHSLDEHIRRDWRLNGLPEPALVYGWDDPPKQRKPNPYPLLDIMNRFGLKKEELLVVDDLKPGYDMAARAGVDFVAAGWSNDLSPIERFMRANCLHYAKTVAQLAQFLEELTEHGSAAGSDQF